MSGKQRPDPKKSLVGFTVGGVAYAVPIHCVREIIRPATLTQLPHLPPAVAGVADHRGEVIPIIALRARFSLPEPPAAERDRTKWILVDVGGQTVGLVVDGVTAVFGTGGMEMRPAPALGGDEEARGIEGVIPHEGGLTFVLDVQRFEALTSGLDQPALLEAARREPV